MSSLFAKSSDLIPIKLLSDEVPVEEKTIFKIKPISALDIREAKAAAGKFPFEAATKRTVKAKEYFDMLRSAFAEVKPDILYTSYEDAVNQLSDEEKTKFFQVLSDRSSTVHTTAEEWEMDKSYAEWDENYALQLCMIGIKEVDGEKVSSEHIKELLLTLPLSKFSPIVKELSSKILEVSELSPAGKLEYGHRFGLPMTAIDKDGSVSIAKPILD